MRLSDYKRISYGKEDGSIKSDYERQDIIYRVFLGDRQVWEKTEEDEDNTVVAKAGPIITTWKIVRDLTIDTVTEVTSIIGKINWGDGDEDNWRSGQIAYHQFTTEGTYNVKFICNNYYEDATLARIEEVPSSLDRVGPNNKLIGVTLGLVPFADNKLNSQTLGVFENVTTITTVIVPENITRIPPRLFRNTSFTELIIPSTVTEIGEYAFTSNNVKKIIMKTPKKEAGKQYNFGIKCIGYAANEIIPQDLEFYCYAGSAAEDYAINNNITPIYL